MNYKQACWAFCAGFSAGVSAAVLFTPQSGADLRRSIAKKAEQGKDSIREHAGELRDSAAGWLKRNRASESASLVPQQSQPSM